MAELSPQNLLEVLTRIEAELPNLFGAEKWTSVKEQFLNNLAQLRVASSIDEPRITRNLKRLLFADIRVKQRVEAEQIIQSIIKSKLSKGMELPFTGNDKAMINDLLRSILKSLQWNITADEAEQLIERDIDLTEKNRNRGNGDTLSDIPIYISNLSLDLGVVEEAAKGSTSLFTISGTLLAVQTLTANLSPEIREVEITENEASVYMTALSARDKKDNTVQETDIIVRNALERSENSLLPLSNEQIRSSLGNLTQLKVISPLTADTGAWRIIEEYGRSAVQFSAFYPRAIQPNKEYGFYVYAHLTELVKKITEDSMKFSDELADNPKTKLAKQVANLRIGTPITIIPECDALEFEPTEFTKKWNGEWSRFGFNFRTPLIDETFIVRVSIVIGGIEIAAIDKCVIEAGEAQFSTNTKTSRPYQSIFISYSRKDKSVVEPYRQVQIALGNTVFIDTYSIRSGEDWRTALVEAINQSDIIQLFWSENSANSEYVRDEINHALEHKCPDTKCREIIRPVFWQQPMPTPPSELGHLNFKYISLPHTSNDSNEGKQ